MTDAISWEKHKEELESAKAMWLLGGLGIGFVLGCIVSLISMISRMV